MPVPSSLLLTIIILQFAHVSASATQLLARLQHAAAYDARASPRRLQAKAVCPCKVCFPTPANWTALRRGDLISIANVNTHLREHGVNPAVYSSLVPRGPALLPGDIPEAPAQLHIPAQAAAEAVQSAIAQMQAGGEGLEDVDMHDFGGEGVVAASTAAAV